MKNLFSKTLAFLGVALIAGFGFLFTSTGVDAASANTVATATFGLGAVNGNLFDRAQAYFEFLSRNNKLPDQLVTEINQGTKVLEPYAYYVRAKIGVAGRVKVIDTASTIKKVGTTNLDRGVIESGTYHIVTDLSVKYGTSDTSNTDPSMVIYNNFVYDNTTTYAVGTSDVDAGATGAQAAAVAVQRIPTKLYNGEFKLLAGSTLLQEGSMSDMFIQNLNGTGVNGEYAFALRAPKLIEQNQPVSFDIEFPENSANLASDKNHFVELKLIGMRIRNRA